MTPERITLIREGVSSWRLAWSRREIDVPAWIGASIDLLDALDAANAELSRLRSSPAQVVGGVPELTKDDLSEACEWTRARGFDGWPELEIEETVANLNKLIAARLPALKPGEVEELAILREIVRMLDEARERNRRRPRGAGAPPMGDEIDDLLHRLYEIGAHPAMRAQPTPTEKEG